MQIILLQNFSNMKTQKFPVLQSGIAAIGQSADQLTIVAVCCHGNMTV